MTPQESHYHFANHEATISLILRGLTPKVRLETDLRKESAIKDGPQLDRLHPKEKRLVNDFLEKLQASKSTTSGIITIKVTPELAAALLVALNWKNIRTISMDQVKRYKKAMIDGHWGVNCDMLAIIDEGFYLGNGQHRLAAIELSKTTQTLVFRLGPPEIMKNSDTGRPRTLAVVTGLAGGSCSYSRTMNELVMEYPGKVEPYIVTQIEAEYRVDINFVTGRIKALKAAKADVSKYRVAILSTLAWLHGQCASSADYLKKIEIFIDQVLAKTHLDSQGKWHPCSPNDAAYLTSSYLNKLENVGTHTGNNKAFAAICRSAYFVCHGTPMPTVIPDDVGKEFFKTLDPGKLECFTSSI